MTQDSGLVPLAIGQRIRASDVVRIGTGTYLPVCHAECPCGRGAGSPVDEGFRVFRRERKIRRERMVRAERT